MNTNNVKKYAPKARKAFIEALSKQAAKYGITKKRIEPAEQRGDLALIGDRLFPASVIKPREHLVKRIEQQGFDQVMEHVAYSWFNRLCAIRYMERKGFLDHGRRVLSAADGSAGVPQILEECLDVELPGLDQAKVRELKLDGTKDEELYRELLLAQCHALHQAMPFLFEAVADESELLLPENLTKTDSLIRDLVASVPDEDWDHIEIIGWLYQFYISEKKDQVIGKVVKSEDIPAATQLFTPNWIVQYLVQNSVGRQWLQTYPDSPLRQKMPYYIEPAEQTPEVQAQLVAITPAEISPESIKVLDPAAGSGHILVEAYKVFKAIYEERGYRTRDIPQLILENNLFGLDIDDRAGQLAGFSLMMLAREDDRRIFSRNIRLNVLSLQESANVNLPALWKSLNLTGEWQSGTSQGLFEEEQQDLGAFAADNRYQLLLRTLERFKQAKTFGSLIDVPHEDYEELKELYVSLCDLECDGDSMQKAAAGQLLPYVHQAVLLAQKYDAVIANPPYMGSNYFCSDLKDFINTNLPKAKQNLYSSFILSSLDKAKTNGVATLITMAGWLYLSTFKATRQDVLKRCEIENIRVLGNKVFGNSVGSIVNAATCKIINRAPLGFKANVLDLEGLEQSRFDFNQALRMPDLVLPINITTKHVETIASERPLGEMAAVCQGLSTADDQKYIRYWFEVSMSKLSIFGGDKWYPINKGGECRKWYGNNYFVVNWEGSGQELKRDKKAYVRNDAKYLVEGITWGRVTGGTPSFRYYPKGFVFSDIGCSILPDNNFLMILAILNCSPSKRVFDFMSENYKIEAGHVKAMPIKNIDLDFGAVNRVIEIYKRDWDSRTMSWDFCKLELYSSAKDYCEKNIEYNEKQYEEARNIEYSINNEVSDAYGWENNAIGYDCTPTLIKFKSIEGVSGRSDLSLDLIEYFIGCALGRYSLDRNGLVYAHSGNFGFSDLVAEGVYKSFPADDDGIIPLTDQEWFPDDATNRFREFVKVVWGETHLHENLEFVAESLCLHAIKPKKSESSMDTIRRYLSTQFYKDHLKTYKKRPIYWLFSSGKQKAFECLVYLHRYNEGTLARMRTEYVIPLTAKMAAYAQKLENDKEASGSAAEVKRLEKEIAQLHKQQAELSEFDEKLRHYADQRISLDLDDGVKVNYGKFGDLLAEVKYITGEAPNTEI